MGAALALVLTGVAVWLWGTLPKLNPAAPVASAKISLLDLLFALVVSGGVMFLVRRVVNIPGLWLWMVAFFALLMFGLGGGPSPIGWYVTVALLAVAVSLLGGLLWWLVAGGWRQASATRRGAALLGGLLSGAILVGGGLWLLWPGSGAATTTFAASDPIALEGVSDPSQAGSYAVQTLTYGSGTDRNRAEFGTTVTLRTETVDGSALLHGWHGPSDRTTFWGFDATQLPLNGRVWYPEGAGPFPLVLIVHGNARADAFSDLGFAYLGTLLASRGYIVASVDQNFLNTSIFDRSAGLAGSTATRGWLVLEHLRLWHGWNGGSDNPFVGRVDTDNIALVGHSRGGEAIAIAAAFNRMDQYPDDTAVAFEYGYTIRSLVALAPSDGFYRPHDQPIHMQNINYLAIQGSHDADIGTFAALNQYERLTFTDDRPWIKSAIYVHRGNHSQFNSSWDRYDLGEGLSTRFFNLAALVSPQEQQQIAKLFVSAFLDATLKGEDRYVPLFHDPRTGHAWLPDTVMIRQYATSRQQIISNFEEDADPTTTTITGGDATGDNLAVWSEDALPRRRGTSASRALTIQADGDSAAGVYRVALPQDGVTTDATAVLRFDAVRIGAPSTAASGSDATLTIEVTDRSGNQARLALTSLAPLPGLVDGTYLKSTLLHAEPTSEPILQTYDMALADFVAVNHAFDPATLAAVAFIIEPSGDQRVLLDNLAIGRGD